MAETWIVKHYDLVSPPPPSCPKAHGRYRKVSSNMVISNESYFGFFAHFLKKTVLRAQRRQFNEKISQKAVFNKIISKILANQNISKY